MTILGDDLNEMLKNSDMINMMDKFCSTFTKYHPITGRQKKRPPAKPYTLRYLFKDDKECSDNEISTITDTPTTPDNNPSFSQFLDCLQEDCVSWMVNSSCVIGVIILSNYCFP